MQSVEDVRVGRSGRLSLMSTGLALVIAFILLMVHQYVVGRAMLIEEIQTEATIIGANSAAALVFNDPKAAQETISVVRLTPRVVGGGLYRADGQRLADTSDGTWLVPARLDGDGAPKATVYGLAGGFLREDVRVEGTKVGTLLLRVSFAGLYWRMMEYALGVLGIAGVALTLAYRLTGRLRRRMAQAEEKMDQLAFYDQVTGLPNRRLFERELRQAVLRVARESRAAALLLIDVDDFKKVNDSFGHAVGDKVLQMIGARMTGVLRPTDIVARIGGDEFGAILHGIADSENAAKVARLMIESVREPFATEPTPTHIGLSIGVAMLPADGTDPAVLLRSADMAMYVAKRQGKNGFQFFSEHIDTRVRGDLQLEAGLRQALKEGGRGLWVAYQPQLDAVSRKLLGVEALLRWQRDDGRMVAPVEFIPVAERSGLIVDLGDWVLGQVCRDLQLMRAGGLELPKVAVNVSPRQLQRGPGVVESFERTLLQYGEPVERFEFELTENALMEEGGSVVLEAFRAAGFSLSIDDFGTGYSSLGYLKRFQVAALKIDRSFVNGLPSDGENAAIVSAVIQMARALNIMVVAEGVETEAQVEFLCACGCHVLQGYLLGRPMPAAELVRYACERWPTPP